MGLFSGIGDLIGGLVPGFLGKGLDYALGRRAADAQERSQIHMYKHRYQWQMEDMKAAGLNPMLAMGQSPGPGPSAAKRDIGGDTMSQVASAAALGKLKQDIAVGKSMEQLNLNNARKAKAEAELYEAQKPWEARKYQAGNAAFDYLTNQLKNWLGDSAPTSAKGMEKLASKAPELVNKMANKQKPSALRQKVKSGYWTGMPLPPYPHLYEKNYTSKIKAWRYLRDGKEPSYSKEPGVFREWNKFRTQMGINQ